jgi:hypothetical protein
MALSKQQEKSLLLVLAAVLAGLIIYRMSSVEAPQTAPLVYTPGMKVSSPVRRGLQSSGEGQDALTVFLARRVERYPGTSRDLFRSGAPKPLKTAKKPAVPVVTVPTVTVPVKTPEEIAAEQARADLSSFRFLGYLTDKDSSLFLSKSGELFIAKSGDTLLKSYKIKSSGKDYVILYDTATKVEVRVELTGSDGKAK